MRPGKNFKNPLYEDRKVSCNVYFDRHAQVFKMKDFGNADYSGYCFWFVAMLNGWDVKMDFPMIVSRIVSDIHIIVDSLESGVQHISTCKKQIELYKNMNENPAKKDFRIETNPFSPNELEYLQKYGIKQEILNKYNVCSVRTFEGYNRSNEKL